MMKLIIFLAAIVLGAYARPQFQPQPEPSKPYDYQYKVEHPPTNTFFGQSERSDPAGRVNGNYYVLLPDGRVMNVEYFVDGNSGFVPKISFQNNANQFQG